MDNDIFKLLVERTKEIQGEDIGGKHRFIEELVDLLRRHHAGGLSVFHFTHILASSALGASLLMEERLEEAEHFARYVRDSAERTRKIISENWPPPDHTKWPYLRKND